jgi:hypothetical protein
MPSHLCASLCSLLRRIHPRIDTYMTRLGTIWHRKSIIITTVAGASLFTGGTLVDAFYPLTYNNTGSGAYALISGCTPYRNWWHYHYLISLFPYSCDDVIRKARSKNPADCFSTIGEFVQALEQSSKVANTMRSQLLAIEDQCEVHSTVEESAPARRSRQKIYPKKQLPPRHLFKKLLIDLFFLIIGHSILWFIMSQLYSWFILASSLIILLVLRLSRLNSMFIRSIISAILLMSLPIGRVLHSILSINAYYVLSLLLIFYMVISMKANPPVRQRRPMPVRQRKRYTG